MPVGAALAAKIARGETPAASDQVPVSVTGAGQSQPHSGYFDSNLAVGSAPTDGMTTPRQLANVQPVTNVSPKIEIEEVGVDAAQSSGFAEEQRGENSNTVVLAEAPSPLKSLATDSETLSEIPARTSSSTSEMVMTERSGFYEHNKPFIPAIPEQDESGSLVPSPTSEQAPNQSTIVTPYPEHIPRPNLYSHTSRSLIHLPASRMDVEEDEPTSISRDLPQPAHRQPLADASMNTPSKVANSNSIADWAKPPPTPGVGMVQPFKFPSSTSSPIRPTTSRRATSENLKRRRSMDDHLVRPPGYEELKSRPGFKPPVARDEEGRESLPGYFCHVHIEGYLPRKMEFSAPGVQSRDRSWKRYYFVLHGTALSVYKHDVHKHPVKDAAVRPVPEVDEADSAQLHVHKPGERRLSILQASQAGSTDRRGSTTEHNGTTGATRSNSMDTSSTTSTARRFSSASSTTSANSNGNVTANANVNASSSASTSSITRNDVKDASLFSGSSTNGNSLRRPSVSVPAPQPSSATVHAREIASHLPFHGSNQLIKQYTLQNAESGLAADYVKKRNVVRVRAEGEQFLLQTESSREVVDWIEVSVLSD